MVKPKTIPSGVKMSPTPPPARVDNLYVPMGGSTSTPIPSLRC